MSDIYLHISSGSGPLECEWVTGRLARAYEKEARAAGLKADILADDSGASMPSCLLRLSGKSADDFARPRTGTVRWIGQSPFRPHHKRKNWFVSVSRAPAAKDIPDLKDSDIRYQTLKASGPGGQHVNATESAVRAVHIPTGIAVTAREERSQHANKRLTKIKLAIHFQEQKQAGKEKSKQVLWEQHKSLERGNEVRVYEGERFRLK